MASLHKGERAMVPLPYEPVPGYRVTGRSYQGVLLYEDAPHSMVTLHEMRWRAHA